MRYYSPVGKGTTLLKAQGSISYVQTDQETYDMGQHWIDRLAAEYGARQAAALRGDSVGTKAAEFWLGQIASEHWHEIIAALREKETPNGEVRGASRLAGEASSAEGATSTVVLGADRLGKD